MAISITVCNLALGELRAPQILDPDEDTTEAAECRRYYSQCLSILLERLDWSFATKIASLAALTTNDRSSEWVYAYALPTDLATAKRLAPAPTGYAAPCSVWPLNWLQQPFIIEAGILYSNVSGAILEYSANAIDETQMTFLFKDALAYSLAARLAVPLRDSRTIKGELLNQAEIATQRAMADDLNRQPRHEAQYIDEVTLARGGGVTACGYGGR